MMDEGKLTSVELTRAYIARIAALNKRGPGPERRHAAQPGRAEGRGAARQGAQATASVRGPAHGLPILLKDLIDVKGMYTSAGNFSLRNSFPATDSGMAKKLRESGVVILGKLGLSEYANYFGNQPSGFGNLTGQVLNGLDADQNPSGSSSGSGTAGAAALSMLIDRHRDRRARSSARRSAQSLVGLRPTVGLVPGYGIAPISASQDTAGPMDRTVANAALTLQSIAGLRPAQRRLLPRHLGPGHRRRGVIPPRPADGPELHVRARPELRARQADRLQRHAPTQIARGQGARWRRAGAIIVERPTIDPGTLPALASLAYEAAHRDIDLYYQRLGPDAPIKSLAEEIADNQANAHEALKFGNGTPRRRRSRSTSARARRHSIAVSTRTCRSASGSATRASTG